MQFLKLLHLKAFVVSKRVFHSVVHINPSSKQNIKNKKLK